MQIKLLKQIVVSIAGESAEDIVDLLYNKKHVNEFLIAKKMNLMINQIRNILYKLADEGIVSFIRKKDKRKGGWYTYFWTLNVRRGLERLKEDLSIKKDILKSQLGNRKTKQFFHCENCELEYNEEEALINDYTCPECGEILKLKEGGEDIRHLEKEIERLEDILEEVDEGIRMVEEKEQKAKKRRLKVEEKKKKKEREERRKKRARKKAAEKAKAKKGKQKKSKGKKVKKKTKVKRVKKKQVKSKVRKKKSSKKPKKRK